MKPWDRLLRQTLPRPRTHGDRFAMLSTPSAIALLVASTIAALAAAPSHSASLATSSAYGKQSNARPAIDKRSAPRTGAKGQGDKARRQDRDAQRRIVTYNLYHDPVFKLNGALADKRQPVVPSALVPGHAVSLNPAAKVAGSSANATALKLQEPESAGIDFGCSDKPFRGSGVTRELTACYKHSVDRSWKAQTYLSREYTEGSPKWGGGLAVRYAY